MNTVYEYTLLTIVCICMVRELLFARPAAMVWQLQQLDLMQGNQLWLEHLRTARDQGMLGPPHLESRGGHLCVVGMGHCQEVQSLQEGYRVLDQIQSQAANIFPG